MKNGVDLSQNATAHLPCFATAGIQFVARYYCHPSSKLLSRAEADAIVAAGMLVVAVWESGRPTSAAYFSYAKGAEDGRAAFRHARDVIVQPAGTAIYFAVDYDASPAEIAGPIAEYFRGVDEAMRAEAAGGPGYALGVYGSGIVCAALLHTVASYAWLAQSTGWRGYKDFADWNIKQGKQQKMCGVDVDVDEARDDFGGFVAGARGVLAGTTAALAASPAPVLAEPEIVLPTNPPSVEQCGTVHLPPVEGALPWRGTPSGAIQDWAMRMLARGFPIGTIVRDVVEGTPVVGRVECHDFYGADPARPKRWHKGLTVYRPVDLDGAGAQDSTLALAAPVAGHDAPAPPPNADLAGLVGEFRDALGHVLDDLAAAGTPFRFVEGFRSVERQQWLYGSGRPDAQPYGRPGPIVTQRDGVQHLSNHQGNGAFGSGRAADCYPLRDGKVYIPAGSDPVWKRYADAVRARGLVAGHDWTGFQDHPHCELPSPPHATAGKQAS